MSSFYYKNIVFIVLAGFLGFGRLLAQPISINVSVDRTRLAINQQLSLTIELSGEAAKKVEMPAPPDMKEFLAFLGSGGTSQNIQFVNGRMSVTLSNKFHYLASKAGTFRIRHLNGNACKDMTAPPLFCAITVTIHEAADNKKNGIFSIMRLTAGFMKLPLWSACKRLKGQ